MELKDCVVGTPVVVEIKEWCMDEINFGHIVGFTYNVKEEFMEHLPAEEKLKYVVVLVRLPSGDEKPYHYEHLTRM